MFSNTCREVASVSLLKRPPENINKPIVFVVKTAVWNVIKFSHTYGESCRAEGVSIRCEYNTGNNEQSFEGDHCASWCRFMNTILCCLGGHAARRPLLRRLKYFWKAILGHVACAVTSCVDVAVASNGAPRRSLEYH